MENAARVDRDAGVMNAVQSSVSSSVVDVQRTRSLPADVKLSPATPTMTATKLARLDRQATPTVTASNLREFAGLLGDGVVHQVAVEPRQRRPAMTMVVEAGGRDILVPVTVQRRVTSVPVIDSQRAANDAAPAQQQSANQQPGEVANQQPGEIANQQVCVSGEQTVQNMMYTDDEITQYVESVDLSYYNQHQQQQHDSSQQHTLRSVPPFTLCLSCISSLLSVSHAHW